MINAVQMYNPNFNGVKNIKPKNVARKVVTLGEKPLKGLSDSAVRLEEQGKDFFERNPFLMGSLGVTWFSTIGYTVGNYTSMQSGW